MRALLDVNVLIALLDADHTLHGNASTWFAAHGGQGWASCPNAAVSRNAVIGSDASHLLVI